METCKPVGPVTERGSGASEARIRRRLQHKKAQAAARGHDHVAVLAYDGTAFAGFARQPGRSTVEGSLRAALTPVVPGLRRFAVAGRTDRGVSATGQVISFRGDVPVSAKVIGESIDGAAPGSLVCRHAGLAPRGFHAQFWAEERCYVYLRPSSGAELRRVGVLDRMLRQLVGLRCLRAFSRETPPDKSTIRNLRFAACRLGHLEDQPVLSFELSANGFLRKMVRVVVATAIEQAQRGAPEDILVELAAGQDRTQTAQPAAPEPLRLTKVRYRDWAPS